MPAIPRTYSDESINVLINRPKTKCVGPHEHNNKKNIDPVPFQQKKRHA